MEVKATTADAYNLFHEGALAMADITYNGIRIDVDKLNKHYERLGTKIKHYSKRLEKYDEIQKWKKKYGKKFNLDSDHQLRDILFNEFNYEPYKYTETGQESVNQESLNELGAPFVKDFIYLGTLSQTRNTFLKNIMQETRNGFLHPQFNLNFAVSGRSSSSNPNFQNLPARNKEMAKIARSCFIPRKGSRLVEIDYDGIEVCASAMIHNDQQFIYDIEHGDMHTDVAKQIFCLDEIDKHASEHEKNMRYATKNGFVFPQFYGDYYGNNATALWNNISYFNLHTRDGTSMKKHLKNNGIKNYKAFENHIKEIENDFWNNRFPDYKKWKDTIYDEYTKTGKFKTLTGFEFKGVMEKKNVSNYPIQALAFHILLWSVIRLNHILKTEGWKSRIVGQIHDSIMTDVPDEELNDFLVLANRVMTKDIAEEWDFINVGLGIEAEATPVDRPWSEKEYVEIPEAA